MLEHVIFQLKLENSRCRHDNLSSRLVISDLLKHLQNLCMRNVQLCFLSITQEDAVSLLKIT